MSDKTKEQLEDGITAVKFVMSSFVELLSEETSQDTWELGVEIERAERIVDEAWDRFCRGRDEFGTMGPVHPQTVMEPCSVEDLEGPNPYEGIYPPIPHADQHKPRPNSEGQAQMLMEQEMHEAKEGTPGYCPQCRVTGGHKLQCGNRPDGQMKFSMVKEKKDER